MKKPMGIPCRRDRFWACEDGLTCKRNISKVRGEKCGSCGVVKSQSGRGTH